MFHTQQLDYNNRVYINDLSVLTRNQDKIDTEVIVMAKRKYIKAISK